MTEAEWLKCEDPLRMLRSARRKKGCRTGERVWRLLACAAARRLWEGLNDPCRRTVETAERFADGRATAAAAQAADEGLLRGGRMPLCRGFGTARWTVWGPWRGRDNLFKAVSAALEVAGWEAGPDEPGHQCGLIRDVFGNPFRRVTVAPAWRSADVGRLAEAAYAERSLPAGTLDGQRLAVLADALEEAGCDRAEMLTHLRGPGPHVRGCWAVDLLRGKA
jgi:hypothetical protein